MKLRLSQTAFFFVFFFFRMFLTVLNHNHQGCYVLLFHFAIIFLKILFFSSLMSSCITCFPFFKLFNVLFHHHHYHHQGFHIFFSFLFSYCIFKYIFPHQRYHAQISFLSSHIFLTILFHDHLGYHVFPLTFFSSFFRLFFFFTITKFITMFSLFFCDSLF